MDDPEQIAHIEVLEAIVEVRFNELLPPIPQQLLLYAQRFELEQVVQCDGHNLPEVELGQEVINATRVHFSQVIQVEAELQRTLRARRAIQSQN